LTHHPLPHPPVAPVAVAALLLAARRFLDEYHLPQPTAEAVLSATGAGRSRAYELAGRLVRLLAGLARPPGRPAAPPPAPPAPTAGEAIAREVIDYLMAHPGAVTGEARRRYSDGFRQHVLELRARFAAVDGPAFAAAVSVPEKTLADWCHAQATAPGPVAAEPAGTEPAGAEPTGPAASPRIQAILAAWSTWDGPFVPFCDHVERELRIPYGRTFIASILELHGVRLPRRRTGRSPDELALRGAFCTFFPGAQWVGDGMAVPIVINGESFTCNLELDVDACSAALVGAAVTDEEDADAVISAFVDGVDTTGEPPLALLLDNRESNHTAAVDAALGDTLRMRSTLGRAQNKAHVEGAFGLFEQAAPPLAIEAHTPKELAAAVLTLVFTVWARALNHKPRADRGGRSRVDLYRQNRPTPEQVEAARHALEARRKQQEQAYATLRARSDPVAQDLLDREFARLALDDPDGHVRRAIARYPLDAILPGLAVFEGKRAARTLPDGTTARYLLGIVRNLAHRLEDRAMTEALIRLRLEARDAALAPLDSLRRHILREPADPIDQIKKLVDHALDADRQLDYLFWLRATADVIATQPAAEQIALVRHAALRIRSAYRVPHERRQDAIHFLARDCPVLHCS